MLGKSAFLAATYAALGERSSAKLLYVQAFVGVLVVPLTYLLARRWTRRVPALVAAGMVGLDDRLIEQAAFLYSEVLYTPLLLGALLASWQRRNGESIDEDVVAHSADARALGDAMEALGDVVGTASLEH